MEIRNNTPSFGMALRKPEDLGKFSQYIVGSCPAEGIAKRGLAKLVKKQSGNAHFDLEYRPREGVAVIPKTVAAGDFGYTEEIYTKQSACSDLRSRFTKKYFSKEYSEAYNNASAPKKVWMTTKKIFAGLRALTHMLIHSEEALPASMRAASEAATKKEAAVNDKLAKSARQLAKREKLESDISRIFE